MEIGYILRIIIVPAIIGILLTVLVLIVQRKQSEINDYKLHNYLIGYIICVAINFFVFNITIGFLSLPCFIITFGPLAFCSYKINKKIIKHTKLQNLFFNFAYKLIATCLIWYFALFPFSLLVLRDIINIPANIIRNQEILKLQEEISYYETYADLTKFGFGIYKLKNKGDKYLWDITKPEDYVSEYDGVDMVYEHHYNRKDDESWDNTWENSNEGKDVLYDVYFYEGTYIIVTPLWDQPGNLYYWGYIYLCKDIQKDSDLFDIGILDPKLVENFRELPVQKISRKELSEKLGKVI